jgi:lipopolysaccharide transport system permease protein
MSESSSTPAAKAQHLPVTRYSSASSAGSPLGAIWRAFADLITHREMTWILFCRDLKATFRGSLLGYVWLFLPPLATTGVWILLNKSRVVSFADPTIPYPLFVLVGTILWTSFTRAAVLPLQIFQLSKPVFSKIKIPLGSFLAVAPLRALFDSVLYALVAAVIFLQYDVNLQATAMLLPLAAVASVLLGFAVALLLLPLSALYSDVQQGLVLIFSVAIYLGPVVYPPPQTGAFAKFVAANPITPIIVSARDWLFRGELGDLNHLFAVMAVSVAVIGMMLAGMRIAMPHLTARMGM